MAHPYLVEYCLAPNKKKGDKKLPAMKLPPPIWLMRQAGRALPEYLALRARFANFVPFMLNAEASAEASLQPIARFDFDAAILFSDILVLPMAMGQSLHYIEGEGPKLSTWQNKFLDSALDLSVLQPSYSAAGMVRKSLAPKKALIGFAGGPFTLLSYMLGGIDQARLRLAQDAGFAKAILPILVSHIVTHLHNLANAGCDVLMIFDSHASHVSAFDAENYIIKPARNIAKGITKALGKRALHTTLIFFPRNFSNLPLYAHAIASVSKIKPVLGISHTQDLGNLPHEVGEVILQGNCDPMALIAGGSVLRQHLTALMKQAQQRKIIINLGHGLDPLTPLSHISQMVNFVRGYKN